MPKIIQGNVFSRVKKKKNFMHYGFKNNITSTSLLIHILMMYFSLFSRMDGPDAKKTACYDIDVEVVSIFFL